MKNSRLEFWIAWRYLSPKGRLRLAPSQIVIILGIAVGLMALIGTLGVMNGLQSGYISAILEVGSYHARINTNGFLSEEKLADLKKIRGVVTIYPVLEQQSLFEASGGYFYSLLIKAMRESDFLADQSLQEKVTLKQGKFPSLGQILLGEQLHASLMWDDDQDVQLLSLPKGQLNPFLEKFGVSGLFKTGYYEYDRHMAIINLEDALRYLGNEKDVFYVVKLKNPYEDRYFIHKASNMGMDVESWRNYNRAFLGALKLEKNMIMFLLSLIFFIVGVSIFQGRRREIEEKSEEIAILRTLGATQKCIESIFMIQGLILGLIGTFIGVILGMSITTHINEIFHFVEMTCNLVLAFFAKIGLMSYERLVFFSPESYYLDGIPVKMVMQENLLFVLLALASAVFSAALASRSVFKIKPIQALRNY